MTERFLLLDIGAGTLDVMYYDAGSEALYKAVVQSPVRTVAEQIDQTTGNLVVAGCEMGGGPVTEVLYRRARESEVLMTTAAASTLNHDLQQIHRHGITIVSDSEADQLRGDPDYTPVQLTDLDPERIRRIVTAFGVPWAFDVIGICAQDHGVPPTGVSHLEFRHTLFRDRLETNPYPHAVLHEADRVPPVLNRLVSIAQTALTFPTEQVFVMDSGMAAILGATRDPACQKAEKRVVMDIATSHTVCAALEGDVLNGFFEYHTRDITPDRLTQLAVELTNGSLTHNRVLAEGGHGAFIRKSFGFEQTEIFLVTGPKRRLIRTAALPLCFGAPWGDNMMTGTVGLLEAIQRRLGLAPLPGWR